MGYNPNHVFTDTGARDTYFGSNPSELVNGLWVEVNGISQQYLGTIWTSKQGHEEYAVGDICINITGVNPAVTKGYGTWTAFGAGKVLIGLDSGDADFDTAEETGGAKTKAISAHSGGAVDAHNVTQPDAHAVHLHPYGTIAVGNHTSVSTRQGTSAGNVVTTNTHTVSGSTANNASTQTHSGAAVGNHAFTQPSAHSDLNVVQPYVVVYFWKRTA